MAQITLNSQQAEALGKAPDVVEFFDESGHLIGAFKVTRVSTESLTEAKKRRPVFSDEEVAEAVRRADSGGPWYTTDEVLEHLSKLEK